MAERTENPRAEQKAGTPDSYARAGVDVAAGNEAVARYRDLLGGGRHPDQLDAIGGLGFRDRRIGRWSPRPTALGQKS